GYYVAGPAVVGVAGGCAQIESRFRTLRVLGQWPNGLHCSFGYIVGTHSGREISQEERGFLVKLACDAIDRFLSVFDVTRYGNRAGPSGEGITNDTGGEHVLLHIDILERSAGNVVECDLAIYPNPHHVVGHAFIIRISKSGATDDLAGLRVKHGIRCAPVVGRYFVFGNRSCKIRLATLVRSFPMPRSIQS